MFIKILMIMTACTKCLKNKEDGEFYLYSKQCKECIKKYNDLRYWGKDREKILKKKRKRDRERYKKFGKKRYIEKEKVRYIKNKYKEFGINEDWYKNKLQEQNNKCYICQQLNDKRLDMDHDHKTNKLRGLLCHSCNLLLGCSRDNINILQKAIEYLQKYSVHKEIPALRQDLSELTPTTYAATGSPPTTAASGADTATGVAGTSATGVSAGVSTLAV